MMKKKTENKFAVVKQLAVLPILAILVMGLSNKEVKTEVLKSDSESTFKTPSEQSDINLMSAVDTVSKPKEIVVVGYGTQKTESKEEGGYSISGGMNGTIQKGSENLTITPSTQNGLTIKSGGDPAKQPLFIVDGTEVKIVENLNPEEIERIEVLKDQSATAVYGDKGKNGVILITTKKQKKIFQPLIVINGKESTQKFEDIAPGTIQSMNSLTGDAATKKYGEKGKNAVIEITLKSDIPVQDKTTGKTKSGEPLFFIVDEMPEYPGGDVALKTKIANEIKYPVIAQENGIQGKVYVSFVVAKDGKVTEPVISKGVDPALDKEALRVVSNLGKWTPGKNGGEPVNVSYTLPINFVLQGYPVSEQPDKQTIYDLRRKIAQSIKYPVVAQENNQQGVVEIWAFVAKDGTISRITDKQPDGKFINIDEVVVTSYKSEKTVTSEKSKDLALLVKESKRVVEQLSPLNIPELQGEMVCFRMKFVLQ